MKTRKQNKSDLPGSGCPPWHRNHRRMSRT